MLVLKSINYNFTFIILEKCVAGIIILVNKLLTSLSSIFSFSKFELLAVTLDCFRFTLITKGKRVAGTKFLCIVICTLLFIFLHLFRTLASLRQLKMFQCSLLITQILCISIITSFSRYSLSKFRKKFLVLLGSIGLMVFFC